MLSIMDQATVVFQAPDPCVPRELAPTATSIVLPANTLTAGKTYRATLSFGDVFYFSTNTIPNMSGFSSVSSTTEFEIKTTTGGGGEPAAPARFTGSRMLDNDRPQMTLTGTAGRTYTLQRATRIGPDCVVIRWRVPPENYCIPLRIDCQHSDVRQPRPPARPFDRR